MYVVGVSLGEAYYSSGFVYGFVWEYIFVKATNSPLTIPIPISLEKSLLVALGKIARRGWLFQLTLFLRCQQCKKGSLQCPVLGTKISRFTSAFSIGVGTAETAVTIARIVKRRKKLLISCMFDLLRCDKLLGENKLKLGAKNLYWTNGRRGYEMTSVEIGWEY